MENGALPTEDDQLIGSMSGPDRMVVDEPTPNPALEEEVTKYAEATRELDGPGTRKENDRAYKKRSKDVDYDGKKDPMWKRVKAWGGSVKGGAADAWNKGKDDPDTEIREDHTVEVTGFMGGMTRQELGMFIFQWGGLMMQNADQGLGGAAGAAGLGAMEGHLGRQSGAASGALEERKVSASEKSADASMKRANQPVVEWSKDGAFTMKIGKDGEQIAVPVLGADGNQLQQPPTSADRPYAAQQLQTQLEATGFFSPQDIAILVSKQPGRGEVQKDAIDAWEYRMKEKTYPVNQTTGRTFSSSEWKGIPESERRKYRNEFTEDYVGHYMKIYEQPSGGGALSDADAATRALQATQIK